MNPKTKVRMLPLADITVFTTPITDPNAAKSSMNVLTPGCWSLNMVVMVTATSIPVTRNMLNARLNLFPFDAAVIFKKNERSRPPDGKERASWFHAANIVYFVL